MIKRVAVRGSGRERGVQHGAAAREEIVHSIGVYREWLASFCRLSWKDATRLVLPYLASIREQRSDLADEIQGIADGADCAVTDIAILNCRTELAYGASGLLPNECTSIGVIDQTTERVLVAENWDWLPSTVESVILIHAELPNGLQLLTFTEAGMLAKFGVNSAGVALCNNLLASNQNQIGLPFHVLARMVLESQDIVEGIWQVTGAPRASSGNFLIGSQDGVITDIEWAPKDFAITIPRAGWITHANHFLNRLDGVRDRTKLLPTMSPSTYLRQFRVDTLVRTRYSQNGSLKPSDLMEVLRDHRHNPEGICRHATDGPGQATGTTNVSVVFDLGTQDMHFTIGPPCQSDYSVETLPWAQAGIQRDSRRSLS